jgi:hypothetical protein
MVEELRRHRIKRQPASWAPSKRHIRIWTV